MVFRPGIRILGPMSTFDPASMPPPMPIPAQALPSPIPVRYGRPGIITAIGVLCIVVASLSGITSFFTTGVYSGLFYMMSRVIGAQTTAVHVNATVSLRARFWPPARCTGERRSAG